MRELASVDPANYDAYVGEYTMTPEERLKVTREGNRLFPETQERFFTKAIEMQVAFVKDAVGGVSHAEVHILRQPDTRDQDQVSQHGADLSRQA